MVIVLAALCALVVTSIASASAMAAGPVLLDIFGNPICADGSLDDGAPHKHGNGAMPDCCVFACAGKHLQAFTPPRGPSLATRDRRAGADLLLPEAPALRRSERTPSNPRAPPRTA